MFDDLVVKPKPRRWRTAVIVGSAIAHAGVIAGIAVAAMWHIEKLDVADGQDITFRVPIPQGASAPPPSSRLAVQKATVEKVVKVKPPVVVQPQIVKDPPPVTSGASTATDPGNTTGPGGDGNDPDADPNSTSRCLTPPCIDGSDGDPEPEEKKQVIEEKKPPIVAPNVAKGLRISGNEQIYPPEMTKVDMLHQGKANISATIQLCVGTDGRVDTLRVLKSSGYGDYDAKLLGEMRDWRYRAYLVNGKPSPMCTVSVFVYRMTK
jgi:TonB family protein